MVWLHDLEQMYEPETCYMLDKISTDSMNEVNDREHVRVHDVFTWMKVICIIAWEEEMN